MLQEKSRDEAGFDGRRIGQALILLQAADLRVAVAHGDGQFALGEADAPAQVFKQITERSEFVQ
jgi:hypothetical protein